MCCEFCSHASDCKMRVTVRIHEVARALLPNPHYHLCRPTDRECDFDCIRCGKLIQKIARLPIVHFQYGCCRRCEDYSTCDFVARHESAIKAKEGTEGIPVETLAAGDATNLSISASNVAKVLIVDDDVALLQAVTDFFRLSPELFTVMAESDSQKALDMAQVFNPHVVVVDLRMPGLNGLQLCHLLKKNASMPPRVLVLTGYASEENIARAAYAGADACLRKPVDMNELQECVDRLAKQMVQEGQNPPSVTMPQQAQKQREALP